MILATVTRCPTPTGAVAPSSFELGLNARILRMLAFRDVSGEPQGIMGEGAPREVSLYFLACPKCGRAKLRKRRCPHCGPVSGPRLNGDPTFMEQIEEYADSVLSPERDNG